MAQLDELRPADVRAALAAVGVELRDGAYLFSNDPAHARPRNPDWATHKVAAAADAAGVTLNIKGGRHYTASRLVAGGFDLRNTAARLGHSGGGATKLRYYADPFPGSTAAPRIPRKADRQICTPEPVSLLFAGERAELIPEGKPVAGAVTHLRYRVAKP